MATGDMEPTGETNRKESGRAREDMIACNECGRGR